MMGLSIILVECDVTSPEGVVQTLRFSDRAIFPMAPTDAARPNAVWDERLIEVPSLKRTLFDDLQSLEPGLGVGSMTLANADRTLDVYQGHVWGEVRVWRWTYGTAFSTAVALLSGPAAGTPAFEMRGSAPSRVRLTMFDYRLELEQPLQSEAFAGNNDGEDVLYEGSLAVKGRLKPVALGNLLAAHIPGVPVNQEIGAYMLHAGRVRRVGGSTGAPLQVFDRGADGGFALGGDLSDGPLEPTFPEVSLSPAHIYALSRLGLMKFNGQPVGTVAFGFLGAAPGGASGDQGYRETPGPIAHRVLELAGVPAERIDASIAAAPSTAVIGHYVDQPATGREVLGLIARSGMMAILPNRQGVWSAVSIGPPAAEAAYVIAADELLSLETDESIGVGAGEFSVGYDRIWTTYRRDNLLVDLHGTPDEIRLGSEYRFTFLEDAAFKARHPSAWRKLRIETAIRNVADAEAMTQTLRDLFGLRPDGRTRRAWRVVIPFTEAAAAIDLGETIGLPASDFGVDDRFLLIGEELLRPRRDQITWTLWG
ncbi:hypothetical protein D3C71_314400 [compost metagenome]